MKPAGTRRAAARRRSWPIAAAALVAALVTLASMGDRAVAQGTAAAAGSTAAQRQARGEVAAKAFVQGQYDEALAIYLDLYAQSGGRPEYLRNIGRCQQKLNRYDPAIESFKEYLRKGKNLSAAEKAEINGFIAEVQAARAASTVAPPPAVPSPPSPAAASPAAAPPPVPSSTPPGASLPPPAATPGPSPPTSADPTTALPPPVLTAPPPAAGPVQPAPAPWASPPAPEPVPVPAPQPAPSNGLRTGGIVALVGAAVCAMGGTVALVKARSTYDQGLGQGCKNADRPASCADTADTIETMNTVSKILFAGAGVAGAAGVTLLIVAPGPSGETHVAAGARFVF